jgi:hypothetical protein
VPVLETIRLELRYENVRLEQSPKDILHILECRILPHSGRHLLRRVQEAVDLLPQLAWLHSGPRNLPQLPNLAPHTRQCRPHCLQVSQLLEHWVKAGMPAELEVESLFGTADKVVFLLDAGELALEDADSVHGRVGTHVAVHGSGLLPFGDDIVDLVLYDLVFGCDLELKSGCVETKITKYVS